MRAAACRHGYSRTRAAVYDRSSHGIRKRPPRGHGNASNSQTTLLSTRDHPTHTSPQNGRITNARPKETTSNEPC